MEKSRKFVSLRERLKRDSLLAGRLEMRSDLLRCVRDHFHLDGFIEVDTPSLCISGDPAPHLDSFQTEFRWRDRRRTLWMPTSPEHHMKRMVASGLGNIYQICRFYRNGELGRFHQPEFTGLEWYEVGVTVADTMKRTERLIRQVATELLGDHPAVKTENGQLDMDGPFVRISMQDAFREFAGINVPADWDASAIRVMLKEKGLEPSEDDTFDDLINRVMVHFLDPAFAKMNVPVFLTDFPAPMAAMARIAQDDLYTAERFELYAGGLELCNGYGELTDAIEQRARFEEQMDERRALSKTVPPLDEPFLSALEHGMPSCSGNALGVDRLLMLLCGASTIQEVTAFPLENELGWDIEGY